MRIKHFLVPLSLLLSTSLYAADRYMLVQCEIRIGAHAHYSDPNATGQIPEVPSCPIALSKVPPNYFDKYHL